ncbi:WASH complex subunit 3 isoform X2 [Hyalella azteca]|uniref:WASH complex subunit 3 isoform X2 n=1 Tax=Hyalella azteca TaxID=294128 RepID=A0A8B7P3G8_HYAAZ|nr:WASH complex subunit 3 isoform X2 [Hyalella azteca]
MIPVGMRSAIAHINLEQVEPLNPKRTLAFINYWIAHMVSFLDQFVSVCEHKLAEVNTKIQQSEDALAILESKLSSISGLENITECSSTTTTAITTHEEPVRASEGQSGSEGLNLATDNADAASQSNTVPARQHPDYATYFKMVAVGVPLTAVKLKMSALGLDPDLLDNPDAHVTASAACEQEAEDDSDEELSSWSE